MDGNFGLRPEIYKALRQDRLAQAARERRANEASPQLTLTLLLESLRSLFEYAAGIIRTPRDPRELPSPDRLPRPAPRPA